MYQVFLLIAEANFPKNMDSNPNGPSHAVTRCFTASYHFAAASVRYPPTIWNRLIAFHLFASAILLYLSSQSFGSSASVPANSVGLMSDSSLSGMFPAAAPPVPQFIPPSAATSAVTFGSNPLVFPVGAVGCVTGWLTGGLLPLPPACPIPTVVAVLSHIFPVGCVVWNPNAPDPNPVSAVDGCRKLYLSNPVPEVPVVFPNP